MTAAKQDIAFQRGGTPTLGVILDGVSVESLELVRIPRAGEVVSWTIAWPDGAETKTTATDGGLVFDRRYGAIYWPIDISDLGRLPAAYAVSVIESNGRVTPYLTGTLRVEG
jgi:hypothetical protein